MWTSDFEQLGVRLADGLRVVIGGGCDYYPGSSTSSPSFSFAVTELRIAGEGDLLIQLERLRRRLHADGLFEPQKRLERPLLPKTIGVVTGEQGKARDDVLAGLRRRGWAGRLVWAFAPVQDRQAAPRIAAALRELAAVEEVQVVIVARGGGSLADLYAFCDEGLCRTVALLRDSGDLLGRPSHRPHADRRRRRGGLLDADPRRRGGSPARLPRRPGGSHRHRRSAARSRTPCGPDPSASARASIASAGPACGSAAAPAPPATARAPSHRQAGLRARRRASGRAHARAGADGITRATALMLPSAGVISTAWRWRWPPMTQSGRSRAAMRSLRTGPVSRSARRRRPGRPESSDYASMMDAWTPR